jgi:hypothetical protein
MILASPDVPEWIASHEAGLIAAWTEELQAALSWEQPFAEALAGELHAAMLTTLLRNGTEREFVASVERSNTGLERLAERAVADRFYSVSLKLARAASRTDREGRSRLALPFLRADVLTDGRELPGSEALSGIILPWDHPFWREWLPPLHPDDIRATYRGLTRGQLERSGEAVTSEDELAWRKAHLTVRWPEAFEPLLDFRRIELAGMEPPANVTLTPEQYREIISLFGGDKAG